MPPISQDYEPPGKANGSRRGSTEADPKPIGRLSILEVDRGLAAGLSASDLDLARRYARADVFEIAKGIHDPRALVKRPGVLGMLVTDGLLVRRVAVADRHCGELVGAGAVLRPWDDFGQVSPLPFEVRWRVMQPVRLAVLDRRFLATIVHWPTLIENFTARMVERSHTLAFIVAIHCLRHVDLRLLAFLWHLADRFGQVSANGTLVPLRLSHSDLAELVGAARPSVSLAVSRLSEQRLAWRTSHGAWMLPTEPPDTLRDMRRRAGVT